VRPSGRTIRDELRREAAKVSVPNDMWQNISQKLGEDPDRTALRRRVTALAEQWRPAVVLAVAAGFFWFALIPSLPSMENAPGNADQSSYISPLHQADSPVPVRSQPKDDPGAPVKASSVEPPPSATAPYNPNVPQ